MDWLYPVLIALFVISFSLIKKMVVKEQKVGTAKDGVSDNTNKEVISEPRTQIANPEVTNVIQSLDIQSILQFQVCLDIIGGYLHYFKGGSAVLNLNVASKAIYKLTKNVISEYFFLRIIGDLPFERRALTSVILHSDALPKKETLLLPPAITHLHFMDYKEESKEFMPPTVKHLSLSSLKNIPLEPGFLPPALTHLRFPTAFDRPVGTDNLPSSLTHIFFGDNFDELVDDLPSAITHLVFDTESTFNQPVDHLPPGLIFFTTGRYFAHPAASLPKTLKFLRLGRRFPHSIAALPPSITHLYLQSGLCSPSEPLPPKLQFLRFGSSLKHPLPPLPPTLAHLLLNSSAKNLTYPHGALPDSVVRFDCSGYGDFTLAQLPAQIKSLNIWSDFSEPVENFSRFGSLTSLTVGLKFNLPVDGKLPPQLDYLDLGEDFDQTVDALPSKLRYLKLGHEFNQTIDSLPPGLNSLWIVGGSFDQQIQTLPIELDILHLDTFALTVYDLDFIPPNLLYLHLSADCIGATVEKLPHSLKHISLTTESGQTPIPILELPPDLAILALGGNYNTPGLGKLLPPTLRSLTLGYSFTEPFESLPPSLIYFRVSESYPHPLPPLPRTLKQFEQMSPQVDISASEFPPRLFHLRTPKKYQVPPTCHVQPDHLTYACEWCDALRSDVVDLIVVFPLSLSLVLVTSILVSYLHPPYNLIHLCHAEFHF